MNLLGNLVKNVGRRPATRLYPAETREMFDGVRGRLEMKVETCTFCTLCAKRCPSDAIVVTREPRTWTLDPYACILCGACVDVCPKDCLTLEKDYRKPGE